MAKAQVGGGGVSFLGLMFLIFLTLKLCGVITWSWVWVFAPLWGPFALFALVMACVAVFVLLAALVASIIDK